MKFLRTVALFGVLLAIGCAKSAPPRTASGGPPPPPPPPPAADKEAPPRPAHKAMKKARRAARPATAAADAGAGSKAPVAAEPKDYTPIKIYYATDRAPLAGRGGEFGPARSAGGNLNYGTLEVRVPRDHKMLQIERPNILVLEFREDEKKHFVIRDRRILDQGQFFNNLAGDVGQSQDQEIFVFIHGFNVEFDNAAFRTAQLVYDLGFKGVPVMYSWPSNGKLLDYVHDETNNEWTVPHLRAFLEDLSQRSRAKRIRIVAHSMGNRALVHALEQIALKGHRTHFHQVILMAPDVDRGVFTELAAAIRGAADKVTLYASSKDEALAASERINGDLRAGDASPQPATCSGIDTIDVSDVSTNFWNDVIGHFYYGQNDSVVSDLFSLLRDIDIRQSPRSQHLQAGPNGYWKFVR